MNFRTLKTILKYLLRFILFILIVVFILFFAAPIWRNLVTYPRMDKAVSEFNSLRIEQPLLTGLNLYRGIIHSHSYWSHDSEGTLNEIIPAAKHNGIDFIFLTDHPRSSQDTFPRGYNGFYDGVLIQPGSERGKLGVWPLDSAIIDWKTDIDTLIKNVVSAGGLVVYLHTEESHNWDNPYYQGFEIYNIHTDIKDEKRLAPHIANFVVNGKKYRRWALREVFDEQTEILALWDSLNSRRKIFGYTAADTHENMNIRARKLDDGRIQWMGPNAKPFDTVSVNFWNRWLFSEPDASGWVFKFMIDTYEEGFNYSTNYVFADSLSLSSITEHIKEGHLYTAFKSLGDAKGFFYWAQNATAKTSGILGDSVHIEQAASLHAVSPLPGQFRLIHNGKIIDKSSKESYTYLWDKPIEKGNYRIEIHISLDNRRIPWLYTNPIYIY